MSSEPEIYGDRSHCLKAEHETTEDGIWSNRSGSLTISEENEAVISTAHRLRERGYFERTGCEVFES